MRKLIAIVSSLLLLLGVLANIDGALSFLTRLGMPADKFEKSMEVLTVILKFVLPIVVIYLLWQVLKLTEALRALKKFRDIEMLRIVDHYNAQLKNIEERMSLLNKKTMAYDEPDGSEDANALKDRIQNDKQKIAEILEYNKGFKGWGLPEYGKGDYQTIYKDIKHST